MRIPKPRTPIGCIHQPRAHAPGERLVAAVILMAIAAAMLATCAPAKAQQIQAIGLHTLTWHDRAAPAGARYEGVTPGVYLRLGDQHGGPTVGVLRNSHARLSLYAGWSWSSDDRQPLSVAFTAAGITGYDAAPVVPLFAPSLQWRLTEQAAVRLAAVPRWHPKQGASMVSLAMEWHL